ncbi:TetR/AcrR family transcriptional regulator [Paenibacillus tepidiphilus]|uniref:TetR/AcrR family transcriptional regulator n=1 Tax=Paenibacillus tepidiphilus TaxID=2608683 RepID=UPI00123C11B5|nr:TetR/AcrR family transcriptional regulator [Paenibacillus tepidiphilus]
MPKGFTEKERLIIREKLLKQGESMFIIFGLKKANIERLTRAVGISKGAFYLFFSSKEELYLEILERFQKEFREQLLSISFENAEEPQQILMAFFLDAIRLMENNPVMKNFRKEDLEYLFLKLPPETVKAHLLEDNSFIYEFINQNKQYFNDLNPKAIAGLFQAIFLINLHKEDFEESTYTPMLELLLETVSNRLIK